MGSLLNFALLQAAKRYFATENIGEDFYVINNEELKKLTEKFDYDSLIEYIGKHRIFIKEYNRYE